MSHRLGVRHHLQTLLAALCIAAALPAAAAAQSASPRHEITVFAGISLLDVENGSSDRSTLLRPRGFVGELPGSIRASASLDGSAEFGVRVDRWLTDTISVGGDFSIAPSHRLVEVHRFSCPAEVLCIAGVPGLSLVIPDQRVTANVVAYHYGGNVGVALPEAGPIRPSLIAGLGAVTYDADRRRETSFALRVGGGVTAGTGPVSLRVDVIDVIASDHFVTGGAAHDVHVRIGAGFRW